MILLKVMLWLEASFEPTKSTAGMRWSRTPHPRPCSPLLPTAPITPQVRWATQLHRLLRVHRRKLRIVVPWRPLYAMLRRNGMEPSAAYQGSGVVEARHQALVTLVHRCRRYFPAGAAEEIWAEFEPALADPQRPEGFEVRRSQWRWPPLWSTGSHRDACRLPQCDTSVRLSPAVSIFCHSAARPPVQALGWVAMLLPTHAALRGGGPWGTWAPRWLQHWEGLDHCRYWDSLWYNLFSRLAKHDVTGGSVCVCRCVRQAVGSWVPG